MNVVWLHIMLVRGEVRHVRLRIYKFTRTRTAAVVSRHATRNRRKTRRSYEAVPVEQPMVAGLTTWN